MRMIGIYRTIDREGLTFCWRRTGAKGSGMQKYMITEHTPAMIIKIQKTHLHPSELSTTKAPMMGPAIGPTKTAATKTATAGPRPIASHISARTPPTFVRGVLANNPAKKRVTRRVVKLFAFDWPRVRRVYARLVHRKMGRRPSVSERPDQRIGPKMYPTRKRDTTRMAASCDTPNSSAMERVAVEGAEEANVLLGY
jgi:hypothetical protein